MQRRSPRRGGRHRRLGPPRADAAGRRRAGAAPADARAARAPARSVDPRALHALGDAIAGTDAETLAAFMDTVNCLARRPAAHASRSEPDRLARIADVWASVNAAGRDTEAYNLDRKPFVFSVFG